MNELAAVKARVQGSTTVPQLLDAGFDAFEVIRRVARACEDRAPGLFAAFMNAAGTAVEGRNALNEAPSLPPTRQGRPHPLTVHLAGDVDDIADELAALAAFLAGRLAEAAAQADLAGDQDACRHATHAAVGICQLLRRDTDATAAR